MDGHLLESINEEKDFSLLLMSNHRDNVNFHTQQLVTSWE